ncbi:hypothetical protein N7448_006654 [Penicillium atrosanguineum]|uniref:AB hydrolase-1 domain-containing protein n=1 Tax=Penicillium atrosanguineum TaxID=1132637 RepID=A0A9W9GYX8_9EURO|nr:hypothetical protein N7448_006654 [Penicillium atrosanguineum]KAJ5137291.1 hypothetical protein N7526_003524 [Penicillium atrosanguineum]KAJ5307986.1 hypothetical protein N7476_008642 [Penicillium atrosanguineum]
MSLKNPTAILIIHGGYFLPTAWDTFSARLTQSGLTVRCPRLPSCGDKRPPTATLKEDVTAARKAAKDLIDTGHIVIVLAHGYGGIVASDALTPDLYANETSNGIVYLILLSAWLVQPGSSIEQVVSKNGLEFKGDIFVKEDGVVFCKNAAETFYNDIDSATAAELAKGNVTQNWAAATGSVSEAPWRDLPTTYVYCTKDLAITLPLQKMMVEDAVASADGAVEFVTEDLDSGHCPFLSMPDELANIVKRVLIKVN